MEFLRPIPSVALILLVSLLLGPGLRMAATLIVYGAVWPVLYNTIAGIDEAAGAARRAGIALVPGVELSAAWRHQSIQTEPQSSASTCQ